MLYFDCSNVGYKRACLQSNATDNEASLWASLRLSWGAAGTSAGTSAVNEAHDIGTQTARATCSLQEEGSGCIASGGILEWDPVQRQNMNAELGWGCMI
jgi:hypothetical protein